MVAYIQGSTWKNPNDILKKFVCILIQISIVIDNEKLLVTFTLVPIKL